MGNQRSAAMFVSLDDVLEAIKAKERDWGTIAAEEICQAVVSKTQRCISLTKEADALSEAIDRIAPNVVHMSFEEFTKAYNDVRDARLKMNKLVERRVGLAKQKYQALIALA